MPYKKGQSGNENGRPKGTPNKTTSEIRDVLKSIVQDEMDKLPETLKKLNSKERVTLLIKLLPYVTPKVQTVSMHEGEPYEFSFY